MNVQESDPAAEFGAAVSLRAAAEAAANENGNDLSDAYQGGDEFMRQCMRIGREFEAWCCEHVDWTIGVDDVWAYLLEDKFGELAIEVAGSECDLSCLNEKHWPLIAAKLSLPLASIVKS